MQISTCSPERLEYLLAETNKLETSLNGIVNDDAFEQHVLLEIRLLRARISKMRLISLLIAKQDNNYRLINIYNGLKSERQKFLKKPRFDGTFFWILFLFGFILANNYLEK